MILDVRGLSTVTDYYLIATGNSAPHLKALATEVDQAMEAGGTSRYRQAGKPESAWIVADYIDFVVHLFLADQRTYYDLERLWNDARRIS